VSRCWAEVGRKGLQPGQAVRGDRAARGDLTVRGRGRGAGGAFGAGKVDATAHRGAAGHGRQGRSRWRAGDDRPFRPRQDRGAAGRGGVHLPVPPPLPEFSALENVVPSRSWPMAPPRPRPRRGPMACWTRSAWCAGWPPPGGAVGGRAAARRFLPGAGEWAETLAGGRADRQSGPGHLGPGVRGADGTGAVNRPVGADRHA
jgi:hypothetical protein